LSRDDVTVDGKSAEAFRTISEVADELGVPQHVLRFWETKFSAVRPMKRAGNRRYYRPEDLDLLRVINKLLYVDGYTIRGVQKLLKENGHRQLVGSSQDELDEPSAVESDPSAQLPTAPARAYAGPDSSAEVALGVGAKSFDPALIVDLKRLRSQLARALEAA
jgi:DNA-binding transcriptional MerR regulator